MTNDRAACRTLVECLLLHARTKPDENAFVFLPDNSDAEEAITWSELAARATGIAKHLQNRNLSGKPVILAYPTGLEYLAAFLGCLTGGVYATPVFPPRRSRSPERLASIIADSTATTILTTDVLRPRIEEGLGNPSLTFLPTDEIDASTECPPGSLPDPDSIAFLQYTSGSVAAPKGVVVTHDNLVANERMIEDFVGADAAENIISWLPLFHDMGLIGMAMQTVYGGGRCVLMSPESVLMKPVRWLQAVTRYRGRIMGAPNFAWDLCARRIRPDQREGIDLSSVLVAFNGSEPVRAETLTAFSEVWRPFGFNSNAWHPCYGLAEATLFVAGDTRTPHRVLSLDPAALEQDRADPLRPENNSDVRFSVACGTPRLDQEVVIARPETLEALPDRHVGEILLRGPNVAAGYWQSEKETREAFHAVISGTGNTPWLRTGDLGFLDEGRLHVTGRIKDLIIIGGRNHYPGDIEATIEHCHEAVRPAGAVAFSVDKARGERLIVAAELERTALRSTSVAELEKAFRRAVHSVHELHVEDCIFLMPGGIPRTTSGKIRRSHCRQLYLNGMFEKHHVRSHTVSSQTA